MLLTLVLLLALAIRPYSPPAVVPLGASPALFSAERALPHLQAIAQRPHPVGSPENAEARAYIVQQLAGMGFQPEVQRAAVLNPRNGRGPIRPAPC
jgi:hypothetical protein